MVNGFSISSPDRESINAHALFQVLSPEIIEPSLREINISYLYIEPYRNVETEQHHFCLLERKLPRSFRISRVIVGAINMELAACQPRGADTPSSRGWQSRLAAGFSNFSDVDA